MAKKKKKKKRKEKEIIRVDRGSDSDIIELVYQVGKVAILIIV